jgi:hypothetical protein
VAEVVARAHWVSAYAGGRGAVREFIELILQRARQWDASAGAVSGLTTVHDRTTPLLLSAFLLALLLGLAGGKAWERYKLQERPLGRSPQDPAVAALQSSA